MTLWVINTCELAQFLDVSYYISKQLKNLSRTVSIPKYLLPEMSCLQLHFLFMILEETSVITVMALHWSSL